MGQGSHHFEKVSCVCGAEVEAVRGDGELMVALACFADCGGVEVGQHLFAVGDEGGVKDTRVSAARMYD